MPEKKKSTAKKAPSVKKEVSAKTKLENQLKKLLKYVDEEGLIFLIGQAEVLRHNLEIDELEKNMAADKSGSKEDSKLPPITKTLKIIPDEDKKNFVFVLNSGRKFITRDEMRTIVKICHSEESMIQTKKILFNWLYKERRDFLVDGGISTITDPFLEDIIKVVKTNYKTR
jgi:hypothetical protein